MKKKDLNEIAKIEKAIKEKYGEEAIQNPKGSWIQQKEKEYLKDLKKFYQPKNKRKHKTQDNEGFKVNDKKSKLSTNRVCPVCRSNSFSTRYDLYMNKFDCCFKCYVQYVEDREERWKTGWRPER